MKLLVVLLAVLAGVWLWQRGRRLPPSPPPGAGGQQTLPMVRCAHCGMHVPGNEVVTGRAGAAYCSAAHRRESEGA